MAVEGKKQQDVHLLIIIVSKLLIAATFMIR